MQTCVKCKKLYADKFSSCPNCGGGKTNKGTIGCAIIIGICVAIVIFCLQFSEPAKSPTDGEMASYMCGEFIKKNLRDPASAEFIDEPTSVIATRQQDGSYNAMMAVRASNGFGGKTVSTFSCMTKKSPAGNWQLQSLAEIN